jgi:glucose/arabinose dehydrogenase
MSLRRIWLGMLAVVVYLGVNPVEAASLNLKLVSSGLVQPVAMAHAGDGSGRLFIVQQLGQIRIHDGRQLLPEPFLDISSLVACCTEQGLLGLAFHPNYKTNGFFYVYYTTLARSTRIVRYTVSSNPNVADPGSALVLLTISQPFSNHNGGQLAFGPEGHLWVGVGDGGGVGDPFNNAQRGDTLLGKLLRINVDGTLPFAIPRDNPFLSNPTKRDEIWALGLRNPWRFSFDRLTGDLFIADVGQNSWEEVSFEAVMNPGGRNYGWRQMEGTHCFNPASNCNNASLTLPILEYSHAEGCSVIGGHRYRGAEMPEHFGTYFFGDFCSGRVWGATENGDGSWTRTELLDTTFSISTFGEDEAGELYLADLGGAIYQLLGSERLYFAQFANGGGLSSEIVLVNPSPSNAVSGRVAFFDDDGLPLEIGSAGGVDQGALPAADISISQVSSVDFSISPLGKVHILTNGQQKQLVGSAVVTSDAPLGGVVRFSIPGIGVTGVGAGQPLGGFIVPVRRKSGGINTAIAIQNTDTDSEMLKLTFPVTLKLTLQNAQGEAVPNGTKTISDFPVSGHLAQFIDELFPDADSDDFEGTLVVEVTDGNVAASALELGPDPGQFTTLPVTPLH